VGKPLKLRVTIVPRSKKDRNRWYLEKIELTKQTKRNERPETYFFGLNDWISRETNFFHDMPVIKRNQALIKETTYRVTTKTSDMDSAGCDANVFIVISGRCDTMIGCVHIRMSCLGQNGDSGELELKQSSTHKNKFERNHDDVFTFPNILSLGELTKVRVRHDNSSMMKSSWHLEHVEIEDTETGQTYMFPCDKWLSSRKDDKQIVRELVCSNDSSNGSRRGSLTPGGKIPYEIEIVTSDKQDAGTAQNGWIIIEGSKKVSERFYMKNTQHNRILRG
jgi:lipoxygenase homology domain-containing protein 1